MAELEVVLEDLGPKSGLEGKEESKTKLCQIRNEN